MPRYYFDTRDDACSIRDDDGVERRSIDEVKALAAKSLAELARDVIPSSLKRELAVEVRDKSGPVLIAKLTFEAVILRPA